MTTKAVRYEEAIIRRMESRLLWRDRNLGKLLMALLSSLAAVTGCVLPAVMNMSLFFPNFLPVAAGIFGGCAFVLTIVISRGMKLDTRDLDTLLATNSVAAVPILVAYSDSFANSSHRELKEKETLFRERALQILRAQKDLSPLAITGPRLPSLIRMTAYDLDTEDRRLLLKVVAELGTPACFAELDQTLWKICVWELRKDALAQQQLRRMVADCKATILTRHHAMRPSRTLLRPSSASFGLLLPTSPSRPKAGDEDQLLRAADKQSE